ncbi:hypothetical protein NC981_05360 [Leptolyngbya sp. DQ-M1]|uniref:hypothetical protein n=1 Tax=Leptolyngbya sp. DQ-M1 TaxID=2933920 RepID=UPI003296F6E4
MQTPESINNLGVLDTFKEFQRHVPLSAETYNFEVRGRSSFNAILSSLDGDSNLKLTKTGSNLEITSNNPGKITDGITRILDPGTYTLTVSTSDAGSYDLSLFAEPGISSSIVWRNSLADQTAFWNLDRTSSVDGAFVNNAPQLGSNSDWKLIGAVNTPNDSGDRSWCGAMV